MPLPGSRDRSARGRAAEEHARRYLESRGLRTLARNYNTRWGELDLVMEHGEHVVFVEVRARMNPAFGGAAASVTRSKQERLVRAATRFLAQHRMAHRPARFDIVALDGPGDYRDDRTQWLVDAFRPQD